MILRECYSLGWAGDTLSLSFRPGPASAGGGGDDDFIACMYAKNIGRLTTLANGKYKKYQCPRIGMIPLAEGGARAFKYHKAITRA